MARGKKPGKKSSDDGPLGKRKAQQEASVEEPMEEEELVVPAQKKRKNGKKGKTEATEHVPVSESEEQSADLVQPTFRSKEKILLLTSRGISPRYRHLMLDLVQLLPNSKKDAKLDTKSQRHVINEVADMKGCNDVIFFETRKHKDLYIWMAKTPSGPTIKFHCTNVHTMAELKLSGNHLKGSRPLLSFSEAFDKQAHWQVMKEILTHMFATPRGHPRSKPFVDHVLSFSVADNRLWIRNYQVVPSPEKKRVTADSLGLVEVGPRLTLNPIKILEGSFGGPVLYSNPTYVSPNLVRAEAKRMKAGKYSAKLKNKERRKGHALANPLPVSELADVFTED